MSEVSNPASENDEIPVEEFILEEYMSEDDENSDFLNEYELPKFTVDYSSAVIVDNLPIVSADKPEKLKKLENILKTTLSQCGKLDENGFFMPLDKAKNETLGFAFANYTTVEAAKKAMDKIDGLQFTKFNKFSVFPFKSFEKISNISDHYEPPKENKIQPKRDMNFWLTDPKHRDQFVIRFSMPGQYDSKTHETMVYWCENFSPPDLYYAGEREKADGKQWVELYVNWSPQGTYLASLHLRGTALWGGPKFEKQGRFAHNNVKDVNFSPCEKYMLTCNNDNTDKAIIIWEVCSLTILRTFSAFSSTDESVPLPPFKWSFDGKYIARKGEKVLYIYELPSMNLLDKKSLKADGIEDFEWSPGGSILAYWAPEQNNNPARVSLIEIPSRKGLRQKNLFNVRECRLNWQSDGTYLSVKVLRHTKTKKTMYNNFELFRVNEPEIPVEMLELRESVVAFAWEPSGDRFAIVHGTELPKSNVTFYNMKGGASGMELTKITQIKNKLINRLYWSPQGQFIVMAGMGDTFGANNGYLNFFDVDNNRGLREREHYRMNYIAWDPSGRYVTTAVLQSVHTSHWKAQMDNGYRIWSFQGEDFYNFTKDWFYQILWRPRPASLLSSADKKKIIKNLRKYEKKFERDDEIIERKKAMAQMKDKIQMKIKFREMIDKKKREKKLRHSELVQLRGGYDSEDETQYTAEIRTREVVLSVKNELA
mmetsp:Transcript_13914/g.19676  ORF Transcript_13914/g.19676 Transcript_13914/m.19676 type:complete len:709 (+) Transcript_13914:83-2209(+)